MNNVTNMPAKTCSLLPEGWYETCEHRWGYISRLIALFRHSLTAAAKMPEVVAKVGHNFPENVKYITTRSKLCSIVGITFSCSSLKSTVQKIFKSMHLHDHEGVALGMLSVTVISADIVDSATTFVNAALETASQAPIPAFSAVGLPLGYTITTLGTISRIIQIAKSRGLYCGLNVKDCEKNRFELRKLLASKFELTTEEKKLMLSDKEKSILIEKKHADLLRTVPPEAVTELKELYQMLRKYPLNNNEVSKKMGRVQALLIKKMSVDGINIGANAFAFSALCMFSLGAVSAVPFILLAASFFIRISGSAFQDLYKP